MRKPSRRFRSNLLWIALILLCIPTHAEIVFDPAFQDIYLGTDRSPGASGTWAFGPDRGINTVIMLTNFLSGGKLARIAVFPDCTYELYSDSFAVSQRGSYSVSYPSGQIPNQDVTFSVEATVTGGLLRSFQWRFNGADIAGATFPLLTIANPQPANAGVYTVVVTGDGGTVVSDPATLSFTASPVGEPIRFSAARGTMTLTWPAGYGLQSTSNLKTSPWTDLAGGSPQTISTAAGRAFYRLIKK